MEKNLWKNSSLPINKDFNQVISNQNILDKANYYIDSCKLKLNYKLYSFEKQTSDFTLLTDKKLHAILDFINNNYIQDDVSEFKYIYTYDLLKMYCKNSIILEFYPINNKQIIGYIIGKKTRVSYFDKSSDFLEVNFLCLTYKLRKLGLALVMINCITKECVINYKIGIAHYTVGNPIRLLSFCNKNFYHRIINVNQLITSGFLSSSDTKNIPLLKNIYNTFSYKIDYCKDKRVILISNNNWNFYNKKIYEKCKEYNKKTYDIYLDSTPEDIDDILNNKSFYNFVIVDSCDYLCGFVSFFRLDTHTNNGIYRNGFYYKMFFPDSDDTIDYLELINEYIYKLDIFDVITFADNFDVDYDQMKCVLGTGKLKYYLFNHDFVQVNNHRNGLITL